MDKIYGSFMRDTAKEKVNIRKHKVNFLTAANAFKDPGRKIFVDEKHSRKEERYFCIGKVNERILTVRFTLRRRKIRIFGAGYWRKEAKYYEK